MKHKFTVKCNNVIIGETDLEFASVKSFDEQFQTGVQNLKNILDIDI